MRRLLVFAAAIAAIIAACGSRSLVAIDVTGKQAFVDVTLIVTANGKVMKEFPHASFDMTNVYRIGVYLPSDMTGTVNLAATADDGTCVRGTGSAQALDVQGG